MTPPGVYTLECMKDDDAMTKTPKHSCPACGYVGTFFEVEADDDSEDWVACSKCLFIAPYWAFDVSGDPFYSAEDLPGEPAVVRLDFRTFELRMLH